VRRLAVRLSWALLVLSLAGVVGGAALIGVWCIGCALIADSVAVGVFALLRDAEGRGGAPEAIRMPGAAVDVTDIFARARQDAR
jgi:hypothetical protein